MQVFLIFCIIFAGSSFAQPHPDAALAGPFVGAKALSSQSVCLQLGTQNLRNETWEDQRISLQIAFGLGRDIELLLASDHRQVHGYDAFKTGPGDTRLGLKWCLWPHEKDGLSIGILGLSSVPTGYQKEITYYDSETEQVQFMPDFSLGQRSAEGRLLLDWTPGFGTTLMGTLGYFSSSDKQQQALKWEIGARLELGYGRLFSEFAYQNSQSRSLKLPSDCSTAADFGVRVGWGFCLLSGVRANLSDDPLWGAALSLRFDGRMAPPQNATETRLPLLRRAGTVLIAPPCPEGTLAEENELWRHLQEGAARSFEAVEEITLPNLPGFPEFTKSSAEFWQGVRYVHRNYPEARWLLVTQVEHEQIALETRVAVPVLVTIPTWEAVCRLKVRLVNLELLSLAFEKTIEGTALQKRSVRLLGIPAGDAEGVLSFEERRSLTLRAYADAGSELREILLEELEQP